MRPVYVFDGKPPELKRAQLDQRLGRREDADKSLEAAKEAGDAEAIERYSKRTIKVCVVVCGRVWVGGGGGVSVVWCVAVSTLCHLMHPQPPSPSLPNKQPTA
jgi:hypothetical protein